jgi:hypothetical protein
MVFAALPETIQERYFRGDSAGEPEERRQPYGKGGQLCCAASFVYNQEERLRSGARRVRPLALPPGGFPASPG